jgi:exonuclease III
MRDRYPERELAQGAPGEGLLVARAARPDVLLMQETKLADAEAPAGVFREAGRWGIKSRQGVRETCRPAAGVPVSSVTLPRFP